MRLPDFPPEVVAWLLAYLPDPFLLAAVDRRLRAAVRRHAVHWDGRPGRGGDDYWLSARRPVVVRIEGTRFDGVPPWIAAAVRPSTTVAVAVHAWAERRTLAQFLGGVPALRRLAILARGAPPADPSHVTDVVVAALGRPGLRSLAVAASGVGLRDGGAAAIGRALAAAGALERCELNLSLNRLSVRGLEALVAGLLAAPALRDVVLDLSGNWIGRAVYGAAVARLGAARGLRALDLRFGGWGMRKQFGLDEMAALGDAHGLRRLGLTIRGALVGVNGFRRLVAGISRLPALRALTLDFTPTTTVGPHCVWALPLLLACPRLGRVSFGLHAPPAALLRGIAALRHAPSALRSVDLTLRQPGMRFTAAHADAVLALLGPPPSPLRVHLTVTAAEFEPNAWDALHRAAAAPDARLTLDVRRKGS